ncbi:ATP-binding protein [Maledivibacter halophilus]|uniref:MinD superfamily P-loop ATPase, contains an inserted ferredoxin domain n=1 Tax=Maledivibacter halophilus TaxID=36842 RepID=A0A1T5KHR5_9FIRM|nr:ATP-binding protein [Maledivibacter halophilus]SKC63161.1 MinD superfamily P-loop ATPase, contains an inserted ferredoxin domain [Maledivibacter halophilus]
MQLVIISGKGGTGKTTIASSLASLGKTRLKIDCDVDASNLHLILGGKDIEEDDFIGAKIAKIDPRKCVKCSNCVEVCRFGAIKDFVVDELACEGCGACRIACLYDAIHLEDEVIGKTIITDDSSGILSRAEMEIGAEGSGKLVTEVREKAMKYKENDELIILDGSPGIGCAVMASVTGCDLALIVVEPTQSGLEDFKRVLSLCKSFDLKSLVCINKFDINNEITEKIESFCNWENIQVVGKIPFDDNVKVALNELKPLVNYDGPASDEIKKMWEKIIKIKEGV